MAVGILLNISSQGVQSAAARPRAPVPFDGEGADGDVAESPG